MPPIRFLGNTVRRLSTALNEARRWRPFHVRLCPALAGIELLKDGGYCTLEIDPEARQPRPLPLPSPAWRVRLAPLVTMTMYVNDAGGTLISYHGLPW